MCGKMIALAYIIDLFLISLFGCLWAGGAIRVEAVVAFILISGGIDCAFKGLRKYIEGK